MNDMILWYLGLGLGSVFFVLGLIVFFLDRKRHDLALAKMSLLEILAAFFLIFPVEYLDGSSARSVVFFLKTVAVTLLDILNIFSADGFHILTIEGHPALTDVYVLVLSLVNLSIMISLIGFVLQFLTGMIDHSVFRLRHFKKVYLFSEINPKTISIAGSIQSKKRTKEESPFAIIFLDKDPKEENRKKVKELGAIYSSDDFSKEVSLILKKTPKPDLFLFSQSEEENLVRLNEFIKLDFSKMKAGANLYVELNEIPWSVYGNLAEANHLPEDLVVNLVDSNANFVLNDLFEHSVFQGARAGEEGEGENRIIDALIVGSSLRSLEMVKALLPLCQMPGYELKLTVIDEGTGASRLRQRIPELKDRMNEVGESIYTFRYLESCDLESRDPERLIREYCPKFTFAFVATDRNLTNIQLGLRLNTLRYQLNNGSEYQIQICADHTEMIENWTPELRDRIELVGGIHQVYNYDFITMSRIEKAAEKLHVFRQQEKKMEKEQQGKQHEIVTWNKYCNNEYKRRSVFARALAIKYKIEVIRSMGLSLDVTKTDDLWIRYEHMRWDMYTRTLGYVYSGSTGLSGEALTDTVKSLSKTHECLVPFDELLLKKQEQDQITLNEEIEQIFQ